MRVVEFKGFNFWLLRITEFDSYARRTEFVTFGHWIDMYLATAVWCSCWLVLMIGIYSCIR